MMDDDSLELIIRSNQVLRGLAACERAGAGEGIGGDADCSFERRHKDQLGVRSIAMGGDDSPPFHPMSKSRSLAVATYSTIINQLPSPQPRPSDNTHMINPTMNAQLPSLLPRLGNNLTLRHSLDRLGYMAVGEFSQSRGGEGIILVRVGARGFVLVRVGTEGAVDVGFGGGFGVQLGEGEVLDLSAPR